MGAALAEERLVSVDSHVHFTDEWVKARLRKPMHAVWDEANAKAEVHAAKVLRGGQKQLELEDFVDPEAARDPGHFTPEGKLAAMDRDGVFAEVIFPELAGAKIVNPALMGDDWKEVFRGYNEAMADFASHDPKRLMTAYQLPLYDIDFAVEEVERLARDKQARCVQLTPFPADLGLPDVYHERYEPLWKIIEETGLTVLNHLDLKKELWDVFRRDPTPQKGIFTGLAWAPLAEAICMWILTGTLEKYPKMKVLFVEPGLGWLPWFFQALLDPRMHQHYEFPGVKRPPSETFKAQCGATFMYEPQGLKACYDYFGPDCLYWSTDFPHPATCWPNSRSQVVSQFAEAGIPQADRVKITSGNAMRTFGLG
ncbi:amidohydrolase family protein [Panacagrimonas perspica]|uniref:Amidohydrolase family protein n=1 Tax=Panacagrimonas perspica TaxID=381431 RepID=A0A4S3K3M0_9GAMM|nr:amidohydrolase family protein [Panacagrimonas perspica]TDU31283.1 amidohydrolase family protein [Panacagrimonas perspica]THD02629.1 amidohydrolase [Panacagrimonas perspica]